MSLHKCGACNKYTLKLKCPVCSEPTFVPRPPKFSPDDRLAVYRRDAKRKDYQERKLI